jgi:asparagine synthase (glutamine-hydrolysing)
MCGIAGIVRWAGPGARQAEIEAMARAISHRGPDGEGMYVRDSVALGHRRLSIIDLELGKQPMSNEDGEVWLTYNGELYNFCELRKELEIYGHQFRTNSDTEVIIHAYEQWGENCLQRFRGMFAFGIADFRRRQLFLARDHFGIKPLYYRVGSNYVAFASELAALRRVEDAAPRGALVAVEYFLRYQYIPTPLTIYKDTYKLPTASYLVVDFAGNVKGPTRYWQLEYHPAPRGSDEEWKERTREVIRDSVKAHLVADVPYGVFLSGGIDSTLVAMHMSQILERPVQAFSIGFKHQGYSELPYAEKAAKKLGVEWHTEIVEESSLEFLPDLVAHYGEPFGDSSALPTWHVSRLARRHVPMVLSGDGGDEGFGGYNTYRYWLTRDPWKRFIRFSLGLHARSSLKALSEAVRHRFLSPHRYNVNEWQQYFIQSKKPSRQQLWRKEFHSLIDRDCDLFSLASAEAQDFDRLGYAQYMDFQTYLPCDILTKVDVASMYHGLEVRTPLIDLKVVEFAAQLPLEQRFRSYDHKEMTGKYVLKQQLVEILGDEFVRRQKQGFSIPVSDWFAPGGSARELLEDILANVNSPLHDWFDTEQIRVFLYDGKERGVDASVLWLFLVLGIWLEQNKDVSFESP